MLHPPSAPAGSNSVQMPEQQDLGSTNTSLHTVCVGVNYPSTHTQAAAEYC